MYCSDLTVLPLPSHVQNPHHKKCELAVGWLDKEHSFTKGTVPDSFLERLWVFCRIPEALSMGIHECEFCQESSSRLVIQRGDEKIQPGSGVILVFKNKDTAYLAPDLIYHYIVDHGYMPPQEFISAVIKCPFPYMKKYHTLVEDFRSAGDKRSIITAIKRWLDWK